MATFILLLLTLFYLYARETCHLREGEAYEHEYENDDWD